MKKKVRLKEYARANFSLLILWLAFLVAASSTVFFLGVFFSRQLDARGGGLLCVLGQGVRYNLRAGGDYERIHSISRSLVGKLGVEFVLVADQSRNLIIVDTRRPERTNAALSEYKQDYLVHLTGNLDPKVHMTNSRSGGRAVRVFSEQVAFDGQPRGLVAVGLSTQGAYYSSLVTGIVASFFLAFLTLLTTYSILLWRKHQRLEKQRLLLRASESAFAAGEEERRRISRDLHDNLAQLLATVSLRTGGLALKFEKGSYTAKQLRKIVQIADRGVNDLRNYILALRENASVTDLSSLLKEHMKMFEGTSRMQIAVSLDGTQNAVPQALVLEVVQIMDEALRNVQKHSGTKKATVSLSSGRDYLCVSIRDQGKGFDPSEALSKARKMREFGLTSMRERAENLGGKLEIVSAPGKGTEILVRIPKKKDNGIPGASEECKMST